MENMDKIIGKVLSDNCNDEWLLTIMETNQQLPQLIVGEDVYTSVDNNSKHKYVYKLVNIVKKLCELPNQTIDMWMRSSKQQNYCVLTVIFQSIGSCFDQRNYLSKLIKFNNNTNPKHCLYDYVYYNICSFITRLNSEQFKYLEEILFQCLLSDSYTTSLFACDVWCFVAKYSSFQLCYDYCCFLMKQCLFVNKQTNSFTNIICLLNRLLHILETEHISNFVKQFTLLEYTDIWILLDLKCLLTEQQVSDIYNEFYEQIIESSNISIDSLTLLSKLVMDDSDNKMKLELFNLSSNIYSTLTEPLRYDIQIFQAFSAIFINLFSNNQQILLTLNYFEIFMDKFDGNLISYEILFAQLMSRISQINDLNAIVEKQITKHIVSILPKLFEKNTFYYTKHNNLDTITQFSLNSKYISVIRECCRQHKLKTEFNCHLNYLKNK